MTVNRDETKTPVKRLDIPSQTLFLPLTVEQDIALTGAAFIPEF